MCEANLCFDASKAQHTSTSKKSKWLLFLLPLFGIVVLALVINLFYSHDSSSNELFGGNISNDYLNHYEIVPKTFIYGKYHLEFNLQLNPNPNFGNDKIKPTEQNKELKNLKVTVTTETDHVMRFKILNSAEKRWQVPFTSQDKPRDDQDFLLSFQKYDIKKTGINCAEDKMNLALYDRDQSDELIFTTEDTYFRYLDLYMVIEFRVISQKIFGLGERLTNLNLRDGTYTLFNRDQNPEVETRKNPAKNLYGSHPFILYQLNSGKFAGLFYLTSNALQVDLTRESSGTTIRYTTIGGIMDFFIFYKGDADFIIEQYHRVIGRPVLPPFWSLGYHYGKPGINSIDELKEVVKIFVNNRIPVDSIWLDSGILEDGHNFIIDKKRFNGLKEFIEETKLKHKIHFVPILEPGIKKTSPYYLIMNLAQNPDGTPFTGKTYKGEVGFPNFWKRETRDLWKSQVRKFIQETGFDGFWLNLNEFSQLCDGQCNSKNNSIKYPFVPGDISLEKKTLPMNTIYETDGEFEFQNLKEFDVHSLNGLMMANVTYEALIDNSNRTFLATRSSYPGIQMFASAHWLGETSSEWSQLQYSIPSITNLAMLGMPMTGSSICGFNISKTTDDLCDRWTQLGLLYPLSLSFNNRSTPTSEHSKAFLKNAILTKYSIVRYIYTTIYEQTLNG